MATPTPHPASLARAAIRRHHPRQEPSALDAHAGICAGGSPNPQGEGLSLPRPKARNGGFLLKRITIKKRLRAKLRAVKDELKRRRHQPVPEQGQWLASVVRGHCAYYAVPGNYDAIETFRSQASRHWYKALRRRSQNASLTWERMRRFEARWLPPAKIMHPWPEQRFDVRTRERSPVR